MNARCAWKAYLLCIAHEAYADGDATGATYDDAPSAAGDARPSELSAVGLAAITTLFEVRDRVYDAAQEQRCTLLSHDV